jgi:hypothetical protein
MSALSPPVHRPRLAGLEPSQRRRRCAAVTGTHGYNVDQTLYRPPGLELFSLNAGEVGLRGWSGCRRSRIRPAAGGPVRVSTRSSAGSGANGGATEFLGQKVSIMDKRSIPSRREIKEYHWFSVEIREACIFSDVTSSMPGGTRSPPLPKVQKTPDGDDPPHRPNRASLSPMRPGRPNENPPRKVGREFPSWSTKAA